VCLDVLFDHAPIVDFERCPERCGKHLPDRAAEHLFT
jgi:hypothetical protein